MEKILVLAHTQADGSWPKAALEAVKAGVELAAQLGGAELVVGVLGAGAQAAAATLSGCGASEFLAVEDAAVAESRYATDVAAATALARASAAGIMLAPHTSRFARCLPGVAYRTGARIDTRVVATQVADGQVYAQRWFYRQRILGTFSRAARPWALLLDSGVWAPWQRTRGVANVRRVEVAFDAGDARTVVKGARTPPADEQTIRPDARLLLVAGAGWTKKQKDGQSHIGEAARLIKGFLQASQASLGSSKSLVDLQSEGQETLKFMTHMNQVGQTGSTPRHPKGLATCCHGEEPHVVGWRFINERRAINLDANCGWAQGKADVLYVADAFDVMARINERLSASG